MGGISRFPEQSNHGGQSPDSDTNTYGTDQTPLTAKRLQGILRKMGIEKNKPRRPISLAQRRRKQEKPERN